MVQLIRNGGFVFYAYNKSLRETLIEKKLNDNFFKKKPLI